MATQKQVIEAVRGHLNSVEDGLFTVPGGRILGFVASPDFVDLDHEQRQHRLWQAIDAEIARNETLNVGPITTMTPDEARLHVAETD